jgi:nicotinamidase-related amidase
MAEVPDPADPDTQINARLIETIEKADVTLWAGEARSHCLANTFRDVVNHFSDSSAIKKMRLLTDACSDVPGFEKLGEDFVAEMSSKGMKLVTTANALSS